MDHRWGQYHYSSVFVEDKKGGFAGLELYRSFEEKKKRVASVIYWDASGEFCVETFGADVPLSIMEVLIAETKERIKLS